MALDVKQIYLSLSLWAQFCTSSCVLHSSDSLLSELYIQHAWFLQNWPAISILVTEVFEHMGEKGHDTFDCVTVSPKDTLIRIALIIRSALISFFSLLSLATLASR